MPSGSGTPRRAAGKRSQPNWRPCASSRANASERSSDRKTKSPSNARRSRRWSSGSRRARQIVNDLKTRISNHENRIIFNEERPRSSPRSSTATAPTSPARRRNSASPRLNSTIPTRSSSRSPPCSPASCAAWRKNKPPWLRSPRSARKRSAPSLPLALKAQRLESSSAALRGQIASVSQQREGAEARLAILSGELEQLSAFAASPTLQATPRANSTRPGRAGARRPRRSTPPRPHCARHRAALAELDQEAPGRAALAFRQGIEARSAPRSSSRAAKAFPKAHRPFCAGLDNPGFLQAGQ